MANLIKLRRSAVQGAVPTTGQLELGELAINTYDGKLFLKRDDGLAQYIVEVGGNIGFEVKNQTGSTISKGTVVKFAGTLGASGRLLVSPFLANGTDPSEYVVGIVENDIPDGSDGFAIDHGKIFNLNTSAFSQGAILYASSTVAGGLTATRPAAPNNKVTVAAVIHSSTTVGILEVRVSLGSSIDNDELVEIGTLADGDTLVWNATNGRFENEQPSGGGSGTVTSVNVSGGTTGLSFTGGPVTDSGTITAGGTLSVANGGTGTATSFTAGSVVFAGASGVYSQDNANLFWDDTNNRLGIGTTSPSQRLDVNGSINASGSGQFTAATYCLVGATSGAVEGQFAANGGGSVDIRAVSNHPMNFFTNNNTRMTITSTGNVGIGTSSPQGLLHVLAGTDNSLLFRGPVNLGTGGSIYAVNAANSAVTPMEFGASLYSFAGGNVGIGTSAPGFKLDVSGSGSQVIRCRTTDTSGSAVGTLRASYLGGGGGAPTTVDLRAGDSYAFLTTTTNHPLIFGTNSTERARIDSAGNVGIGLTSLASGYAGGGPALNIKNGGSVVWPNASGTWNTTTAGAAITYFGDNNLYIDAKDSASNMLFRVNGDTERMRIDSAGNVGIGTTTPGYKLSVSGTAEITAAKEGVFTVTDGTTVNLDPNNGSLQTWTLGANRTPGQANWAAGQSITLQIDDGSAYTLTWTTLSVVWTTDGGSAPTLNTSGVTNIVLWKVGTTIYGARVGDA
jgi:hypothetical protein